MTDKYDWVMFAIASANSVVHATSKALDGGQPLEVMFWTASAIMWASLLIRCAVKIAK